MENPTWQSVHYKKNFGWMDVRELNPEELEPLFMMASAT
jgi:hypothetical protein